MAVKMRKNIRNIESRQMKKLIENFVWKVEKLLSPEHDAAESLDGDETAAIAKMVRKELDLFNGNW
jgi:hypothetical protein